MTKVVTEEQPPVITIGELKQYISIYHDDLPVTVQLPTGEYVGVLTATTAVVQPGTILVFAVKTTEATSGKTVKPVVVA